MTTTKPAAKPKALTDKEADKLGAELEGLMRAKAATEARITEIQTRFRESWDLGTHLAGNVKVSVQRNVRRDDKAFMAEFPFESFPDYYKPTIDTDTVKHELAPAVLERFQVEGPNKVVFTILEAE